MERGMGRGGTKLVSVGEMGRYDECGSGNRFWTGAGWRLDVIRGGKCVRTKI